jgi:RNA polymerase sigma-70 factor (ECF subfamily)
MNKVIDTLPESRRRIFIMKTVEGKSIAQIAEEMNISPKTVETQIYRAKSTLKEHVSKLLYLAIILTFQL